MIIHHDNTYVMVHHDKPLAYSIGWNAQLLVAQNGGLHPSVQYSEYDGIVNCDIGLSTNVRPGDLPEARTSPLGAKRTQLTVFEWPLPKPPPVSFDMNSADGLPSLSVVTAQNCDGWKGEAMALVSTSGMTLCHPGVTACRCNVATSILDMKDSAAAARLGIQQAKTGRD